MKIKYILSVIYLSLHLATISAMHMSAQQVGAQIQLIPLNPQISQQNSQIDLNNIRVTITAILANIANLPRAERVNLFAALKIKVDGIAPAYQGVPGIGGAAFRNNLGPQAFTNLRNDILGEIVARRLENEEQLQAQQQALLNQQNNGQGGQQQAQGGLQQPQQNANLFQQQQQPNVVVHNPIQAGNHQQQVGLPGGQQQQQVNQPNIQVVHQQVPLIPQQVLVGQLQVQQQQQIPPQQQEGQLTLQQRVDAILTNVVITDMLYMTNTATEVRQLRDEINNLQNHQEKIQLLERLKLKIESIKTTNINVGAGVNNGFKQIFINTHLNPIKTSINDLINPPQEDLLDPNPTLADLQKIKDLAVGAAATKTKLDINMADNVVIDQKERSFELRLKNYLTSHWTQYYKAEGVQGNIQEAQGKIQDLFDGVNANPSPAERRKIKVNLIAAILHKMLAVVPTTVDELKGIIEPDDLHVYTNMEKIKALPKVDWDELIQKCVYDVTPALKRNQGEDDANYWRRVGNHVIGIYNTKVKPHIYPNTLLQFPTNNLGVNNLVPLNVMYADVNDATTVYANDEGTAVEFLNFDVGNPQGKNQQFKQGVVNSYNRVNDSIIQTLARLFGAQYHAPNAIWDWWHNNEGFTTERVELCKKALVIFTYLNRPQGNYGDDMTMMAALAGRLLIVQTGKKQQLRMPPWELQVH